MQRKHLAWHETMELHELTASTANNLIALKMHLHEVTDPKLHALYEDTIKALESNLKELLHFYSMAPTENRNNKSKGEHEDMTGFYAGHLLGMLKCCIKNYATAITETATPQLRDTFVKQLNGAIKIHAKVFNFMMERGLYHAYDLHKMLENDKMTAKKALEL
ncbi:spore coat protein [Paenibacillus sp. J23TS9]|uniref:spore coat protein n=1 Tax=Paenibacillus sp. J23TS9 TaxID=2807193 RepID=UPI001BD0E785|nr:spore coat protein [Paenibacillus sp. J23TS9]